MKGTALTLIASLAIFSGSSRARELPSLPHAIAGQFVGAIHNALVVAGGSSWTAPPSEGGVKTWDNRIQTLQPGGTAWQYVAHLPQALAYGGAVSLRNSMVIAGGENAKTVSNRVWNLTLDNGRLRLTRWPDLPVPLTNFSMAFDGSRIYIYGGQTAKNSLASAHLWSLTIHPDGTPGGAWQEEAALPGPGRILAAAVGCGDKLYVIGGATLTKSNKGMPVRRYLREGWSYDSSHKWVRLADPPAASVGAPAVCAGGSDPLLLGGDDGHMAGVVLRPGEKHPGFSHNVVRYDAAANAWTAVGHLPIGLVTTGATVLSDGQIVIPGGEDRPGNRSSMVLGISPDN